MFGRKKNKPEYEPYTYYEFMLLYPTCNEETQLKAMNQLAYAEPPEEICGHPIPQNLNGISYGQLDDLHDVQTTETNDVVGKMIEIITGEHLDYMNERVEKIFGFMYMVQREITRINNIFNSIERKYSSEEIAAGVKDLNFGSFGILDWYAKRMGITDQNEVRKVSWVRIFTCMKNDHEQSEYERRLHEQYNKPLKRKGKK